MRRRVIGDHRTFMRRLHADDRALEWFSALALLGWGASLLFGQDVYSPLYKTLHNFGSKELWAVCLIVVGTARIAALGINGLMQSTTPVVRLVGAMLGVGFWAEVACLLTQSVWEQARAISPGMVIYALLAGAEIFSVFRAAVDARSYPT